MNSELPKHPYAAALLSQLQGEEIEIYNGDIKTTQILQDREISQKNVVIGILKDVIGDCLIVEVFKNGRKGLVYINAWTISHVMRVKDPLFLKDIFTDEHELNKIKLQKNGII